jgi:hypothetical protein
MASRKIRSLVVVALLAGSGAAHAAPSAAERETARRLMDEGKARMKDQEYTRAIEAFQKAHDIMHVPTTGLALARAHLAAGHLVEARDAALEVGRMPHEANEPAVFESARKHAKEIDAQLKARIPTLRVKVKGGTAARVMVDDIEIPASLVGEPIAVNPGKRVVVVKGENDAEARGEIEIAEKESKEIELVFSQKEAPKTTSSRSKERSEPVKVRGFGNDDVELRTGQRTALSDALIYGGLAVGGVGIAVGAVTGAMTLSEASDLAPQCANSICAPSARETLDSASTLATISTIGFVAAAVGLTVCVVGLSLPKEKASASAIFVGPGGVGGTF